ncbi:hypothetical protein Dimus_014147, partial [Dionaea muscipula]
MHWAREVGKMNGMVVVTKRSEVAYGRVTRLILCCERSGVYRDSRKNKDLLKPKKRRASVLSVTNTLADGNHGIRSIVALGDGDDAIVK